MRTGNGEDIVCSPVKAGAVQVTGAGSDVPINRRERRFISTNTRYFKGSGDGDAFDSYQELGRFVDIVKNRIAGDMGISAIGAAQATVNGKVADSAKIGRNASTIAMIQDKTPEEIATDGPECGNKKLRVILNRNGMQMAPGEYIDLFFDGNRVLYEQAKQHIPLTPY